MNKVGELLASSKAECIILKTSERVRDENFHYFTGLGVFENPNGILILRKGKAPLILASALEYDNMKGIKGFNVVKVNSRKDTEKIFSSLPKSIGINYQTMTLASLRSMRKMTRGASFTDVSKQLAEARSTKTNNEIRRVRKACAITSEIFDFVVNNTEPGMTEKGLAEKIEMEMNNAGVRPAFPTIVAFGRNSAVPHHVPSGKKIERKGVLLVDIGVVFDNYCSDMTRTFFIGRSPEDVKRAYAVVRKAYDVAQSLIRPGSAASAVFKKADSVLRKELKQGMIHSLGHGVGMNVHDFPEGFSDKSSWRLKEKMVLSLEPGYYKNYGIRIEDNFVVRKRWPEMFGKAPKELVEI